jgi:hypothetical protein
VTMAAPGVFSRLCTTAPNRAASPRARNRGKAAGAGRACWCGSPLRPPEAGSAIAGHRHDAVRREALGQHDVRDGMTRRVSRPPSPARRRARGSRGGSPTPAPPSDPRPRRRLRPSAMVTRRLTMFWRESSGHHLQRLGDVHRGQHVRGTVPGEREDAVVDRPQRDLGGAALPFASRTDTSTCARDFGRYSSRSSSPRRRAGGSRRPLRAGRSRPGTRASRIAGILRRVAAAAPFTSTTET